MKRVIKRLDRLVERKFSTESRVARLWNHPAGPKTVFFWAPAWKWSLVIVGLADLSRPAHKISLNNSVSLVANGAVYTRWYYWAIEPRNALGASCSFFLAFTGLLQAYRRYEYDQNEAARVESPDLD